MSSQYESMPEQPAGNSPSSTTFNFDDPAKAASEYARIMHEHTRQQMELGSSTSLRRTAGGTTAPLSAQSSTDSTDSSNSTPPE